MRTSTIKYIFLVLIFSNYSLGCAWINGTTIDGHWVERSGSFNYIHQNDLKYSLNSTPKQKLYYFKEKFSEQGHENNITKAVFLMLDGNYKESIQKLLIEENLHDKSYEVATNLGTAYELAGDNVNALKWIQEGINRNPDSHYGTEWLHVKILETKLKLQDDPAYLKDHHVINFDEYAYENPRYKEAILYQLRERMLFVKPKDPVIADLLYSYALANANDGGFLEYSMETLELSEKYGYSKSQTLIDKKKEFQDIIDHVALMKSLKISLYVALFFLFLFIAYKKKWFFLTSKAQQAHIEESNNFRKTENLKDKKTNIDHSRPITSNVIYFIMIFSLLFLLVSIFVQITITPYDVMEENGGLVFMIAAILTGLLELIYLWKFDKFLNQEDVKIKEVKYGLILTALGIFLFFFLPFLHRFFNYDTGIYIFLTGVFLILGLFFVNSGLRVKRIAKKKTKK